MCRAVRSNNARLNRHLHRELVQGLLRNLDVSQVESYAAHQQRGQTCGYERAGRSTEQVAFDFQEKQHFSHFHFGDFFIIY